MSITGSHWQIRSSASSYELFFLSFILLMRGCRPRPWGGPSTPPSPSPPRPPHLISLSLLKVVFIYFCCAGSLLLREGLSLVAASGVLLFSWSTQAFHRGDFSCRAWALGAQAPVAVVLRLSCSAARGTFPDQGSDRCRWHWQAGSYPPDPQGSPASVSGLQSPALGFRHPAAPALSPPPPASA